jgi:hypothetical protein
MINIVLSNNSKTPSNGMIDLYKKIQTKKKISRRFSWKHLIIIMGTFFLVIILAAVLFIKLNVEAAANFTDNTLRPLLGANTVVFMEKIFFNTSDKFNQLLSHFEKQKSPFSPSPKNILENITKGTMDLNPITTASTNTLDQEGVWQNIPLSLFPKEVVLAKTFIRPDITRSYAFVVLVKMNMSKLQLWSVAGTVEPASKIGNPGPGIIPASVQNQGILIAAFDGGFQYRDGQYGMIVGNKTYLPLKKDLATLLGYTDGTLKIVKYNGQDLGSNISFIRQNCPMLIENGVVAESNAANRVLWGRTTTWQITTWRSGIGITSQGDLVFAIGNSLVPSSLAKALLAAGAVNAMQLDINPNWVRFNVFNNFANNHYSSTPIMDGIKDGSFEYLNGDKKDFFYLTKK